jgi:hypothetical protein
VQAGRVLIIDDVISAGTSVRESIAMIDAAGATPCGVSIALDRQEKAAEDGSGQPWSAVQYVHPALGLPVVRHCDLGRLAAVSAFHQQPALGDHVERVGLPPALRYLVLNAATIQEQSSTACRPVARALLGCCRGAVRIAGRSAGRRF